MPRITQIISRFSQRMLVFVVEEVRVFWHIVGFIVVVVVFGLAYHFFTPMGHGIGENLKPLSDVTIWTGIYFSIVTISSLGYGHMHPMGFSKALACVEVLIGIAVVGVMIAKVTSQRLSYHVARLFSTDAQKRLEDVAAKFETSKVHLDAIMPELVNAYQIAPSQESSPNDNKNQLISQFREVIGNLQSECVKLRDYLSNEIEQGKYFQSVPAGAVTQVGNAIDGAFLILGQLISSAPIQARIEILDNNNRQMISEAVDSQKKICNLVDRYATDEDTRNAFRRIREICEGIPTSYFAVPEESQPDQILQGTEEPQEPSEVDN